MSIASQIERPAAPSNRVIAAELGIAFGAPNSRNEINRRRHEAPSWQAYQAAIAAYNASPERQAQRAAEAAQAAEWRARREADEAARLERDRAVRAEWLAMPCRWQRGEHDSTAKIALLTLAHRLAVVGKRRGAMVEASPRSETRYLWCGSLSLRLSNHELGYADYGTRRQAHRGPQVICGVVGLAEVIAESIAAVREAALLAGTSRRDAAKMIRVLRAARR